MHMVVLPAIADLRIECAQALNDGQIAKAVWIRVRALWDFFKVFALHFLRK
jgi:hypothetical protein